MVTLSIASVEAVQLVEALSCNRQLSKEHKHAFIKANLQPHILETWNKDLEYKSGSLVTLFRAVCELEYFDKELIEKLFETIKKKKQLRKSKYVLEFFETFSELQEKGVFYRDLSDDISHNRQILESKPDVMWKYNLDERRELTYFEMKAVRDDFKYLDQFTNIYTSQVTEDDMKERQEMEDQRAQFKREYEKEQAMNDIVREQYVRLLRGDAETGLEDFDEAEQVDIEENVAEWQKLEEGKDNEFIDMTKVKEPKKKLTPEEIAKLKERQKQNKKITKAALKEASES